MIIKWLIVFKQFSEFQQNLFPKFKNNLFISSQEYEDRQLVWEQYEVELERKIARLEKNQDELFEAAQKVLFSMQLCIIASMMANDI